MHLGEKRLVGVYLFVFVFAFFSKKNFRFVIFPHRYLDRNKLTNVPSDVFSELTNLKYVWVKSVMLSIQLISISLTF